MLPFNFHHLFYFYTIASQGSISNASKHLRVSQPALSTQLKRFERYLEVDLFQREGRNLILTDHGRMVMAYARTIFNAGQELRENLIDRSKSGRLHVRVGVAPFSSKACTMSLVSFFLRREPAAHITLEENQLDRLAEKLNNHSLDVIISDVPFPTREGSQIQNKVVDKVPVVFCAHREIAKKYRKLPKGLSGAPLILPSPISPLYGAVQDYLVTHQVKPRIVAEVEDPEIVGRMLAHKKGIGALNCYSVLNSPWKKNLVKLGPRLEIEDTIYLIAKKRKRLNPLVEEALKDFRLKLPSRWR